MFHSGGAPAFTQINTDADDKEPERAAMTINPAETPLAQPLLYADAARRVRPGARPAPLGVDFARGINAPAIRVELSETARQMQQAQTERLAALQQPNADNISRAARETPRGGAEAPGAQELRQIMEDRAEKTARNARARAPAVNFEPEPSILATPGGGLRDKLAVQERRGAPNAPLQEPLGRKIQRGDDPLPGETHLKGELAPVDPRPPEQKEPSRAAAAIRLERAPTVLASGKLSAHAQDAYEATARLS